MACFFFQIIPYLSQLFHTSPSDRNFPVARCLNEGQALSPLVPAEVAK